MFTTRGQVLVISGVFFLTSGFAFINYYLVTLGVFLILASILNLPLFKRINYKKNLKVERKIDRGKVFAKDFVYVSLSVENLSNLDISYIEIHDEIPKVFNITLGKNTLSSQISSKGKLEFSYIIQPRIRGEYKIGPTTVTIYDRLRLNSEEIKLDNLTDILVYPPYEDIRKFGSITQKRILGIIFGSHKAKDKGIGMDFFGIRRYTPSDELRWVDWKATARTGKMMTREYETERNIKFMIVLDSSSSMSAGDI
ncbi:MAG: DUF58 domain-containing protein, partial [Candidatus Odinarchaeia archaeon]